MLLTTVNKVLLPESIISETFNVMRKYGRNYQESVCLWIGKKYNERFKIMEIIVPIQENSMIDFNVDSDELDRINRLLYQKKSLIIAQIHSHPSSAFHSETDDEFPIITTLGGFSIVIPNFGFISESELNEIKYFRLQIDGWRKMNNEEIGSVFKIQSGK